uniref:hypothetical protein n=1 Tax=Treponema endosymbiont of Eucomonympha sp. TaxID=1580831 RepID=UPI000A620A9A
FVAFYGTLVEHNREHFQGRKASGDMNTKTGDKTCTVLLAALRGALKMLTVKILPEVYEYGFLKE